jgi:hypothetical protein
VEHFARSVIGLVIYKGLSRVVVVGSQDDNHGLWYAFRGTRRSAEENLTFVSADIFEVFEAMLHQFVDYTGLYLTGNCTGHGKLLIKSYRSLRKACAVASAEAGF